MPNKMNPEKRFMSCRVKRTLYYKLVQEAEARGISRSDWMLQLLEEASKNVKLRPEYQERVTQEIEDAKKERKKNA